MTPNRQNERANQKPWLANEKLGYATRHSFLRLNEVELDGQTWYEALYVCTESGEVRRWGLYMHGLETAKMFPRMNGVN